MNPNDGGLYALPTRNVDFGPLADVSNAERDLLLWVVLLEPHCGVTFNAPEVPQCVCGERVEECVVRQYVTCVLGQERARKLLDRQLDRQLATDATGE